MEYSHWNALAASKTEKKNVQIINIYYSCILSEYFYINMMSWNDNDDLISNFVFAICNFFGNILHIANQKIGEKICFHIVSIKRLACIWWVMSVNRIPEHSTLNQWKNPEPTKKTTLTNKNVFNNKCVWYNIINISICPFKENVVLTLKIISVNWHFNRNSTICALISCHM